MFEVLTGTRPVSRSAGRVATSGLLALAIHVAVIYTAVMATLHTGQASPAPRVVTELIFVPDAADRPPVAEVPAPPPIHLDVTVPTTVPVAIPPIDSAFVVDSLVVSRVGLWREAPAAALSRTDPRPVLAETQVDQPPELLGYPPLDYPDLLRQAGVGGQVLVEAVIDTSGRVERGSLRVLEATNRAFEAAARDLVSGARYRPGRLRGEAVRVSIRVPVVFQIQR